MENLQNEENSQNLEQQAGGSGTQDASSDDAGQEQINQEAVNKAIGRQHKKFQDERRRAEGLQQQLNEKNARLAELEAGSVPEIPPVPDTFDPDYVEKMKTRDAAIVKRTEFDANQAAKADANKQAEKDRQDAQNQSIAQKAEKFRETAVKLGVDAQKLAQSEQTLATYQISPDVASHILGMDNGPLVVEYLANNVLELDALTSMDPLSAAVHLSTKVAVEASKLKPQSSNTPDPLDVIEGQGAGDTEDEMLKGLILE